MTGSHTPTGADGPVTDTVVERLLAFIERTNDLIGVTDDAGNVIYVNRATQELLGLSDDELGTLTTADLFPAASFGIYHDQIRPAILRDGVWSGTVPVHAEDGTTIDVWLTVVGEALPGGEIAWLVTSGRDFSEWRRLAEELSWRATHDDLTGLARRVLLDDRLDLALARARRDAGVVAVMFLDLDDLKAINDSFGHRAGDAVLAEVGRRMEGAVRGIDTVARLGGDEFVVVFDGVEDEHEAEVLAQRVRDAVVAQAVDLPDASLAISVSVGVTTGAGDVDAAELLRRADAAMYDAKRAGRGDAVAVSDGLGRRRAAAVQDLASAITQRLVVPHYQRVVDLRTGAVVGQQALARWGSTPASDFLALTEGSGIGLSLDLAVLRQATADAATWSGTGPGQPRVYVHVTARFLAEPSMAWYVSQMLERTGLEPPRLAIEIPEQIIARRTAVFTDAVRRLRTLGVRLVVSDVGLHGSPVAELAEGVFDEVRLAVPLVLELPGDATSMRAAAGVTALAHVLGVTVAAAGVERQDQHDALAAIGCDLAAGRLVGDVVPAAEIATRA
jgi:diguanylate cyclase (GGDEF)-like protein/PAS domain S-box-containing protein